MESSDVARCSCRRSLPSVQLRAAIATAAASRYCCCCGLRLCPPPLPSPATAVVPRSLSTVPATAAFIPCLHGCCSLSLPQTHLLLLWLELWPCPQPLLPLTEAAAVVVGRYQHHHRPVLPPLLAAAAASAFAVTMA